MPRRKRRKKADLTVIVAYRLFKELVSIIEDEYKIPEELKR